MWFRNKNADKKALGFICLCLEFTNALVTLIKALIYPLYNLWHLPYADIIFTPHLAITLISSVLVVFFWLDLTTDYLYHGKFLGKMKKPAIVFILLIIVLEITEIAVRCIYPVDTLTICSAIYGSLHVIIVIFYIVAGKKVLQNKNVSKKTKITKITKKIFGSAAATLFGVIGFIMVISPATGYPAMFITMGTIIYVSYWLQSFLLMLIFKPPKPSQNGALEWKQFLILLILINYYFSPYLVMGKFS